MGTGIVKILWIYSSVMSDPLKNIRSKVGICLNIVFLLTPLSAYEVVEIKDGGIIAGTVKYTGRNGKDTLVKVNTHAEYCGEWVNPGRLVISETLGVQWAVVMITEIEKGKKFDNMQNALIHNVNCGFEPRVSVIKENRPINVVNGDKIPHRAKFGLADRFHKINNIMALAISNTEIEISVPRIIQNAGLVSVAGIVHPFEQGWVWKLPHPYAAVTDDNGRFKISDVPQGMYKIRIWHELLGEQEKIIKVNKDNTSYFEIEF